MENHVPLLVQQICSAIAEGKLETIATIASDANTEWKESNFSLATMQYLDMNLVHIAAQHGKPIIIEYFVGIGFMLAFFSPFS